MSGFAKRFDYDPEIPFTSRDKPNHSWNAVFVEEDWRFVDCCWGAGREDEAGRWTPKFEEFWFLTDPDKFINDHYPCMSTDTKIITNWQLMKQPISLDEFNKTVRLEEVLKNGGLNYLIRNRSSSSGKRSTSRWLLAYFCATSLLPWRRWTV